MNDIQVYDLYDIWYTPWWHHWSVKVIAFLLIALILCVVIWLIVRRFTRAAAVPYWQQALDQCAKLKAQLDTLEPSVVYARLTTILKTYIAARYVHKVRSTTEKELIQIINQLALGDEQKKQLQHLLTQAVPAKFANEQPDLQGMAADIEAFERFVGTTRPTDTP